MKTQPSDVIYANKQDICKRLAHRGEQLSKKKGNKTNHKNWSIPTKSQHIDVNEEEQDSI